jgi:hypothetical protein
MDKGRLDMAAQMLQKAVEESGSQSGGIMDISPKRVSDKEHGKFLNKLFKDIAEDGEARKYLEEQRYKLFEDTLQKNIKKAKALPMEIPAKMLNETKGVVKKVGSAVPFAGPAMAAGEVLAGENDLGKMAAGLAGSEILGTLASMVPGSGVTKGIMAGTGAVAGYPVGQEVYKKVVPESVQEKLKLSPEDRMKIKEMLSKMKKKVF